ncbi:hypothetical protein [Streptomyces spinosirectus]
MPTEVIDMLAGLSIERALFLAVAILSASLIPFFLLINVDFAATARTAKELLLEAWVQIALTLAALLILTIPTGDNR